MKALNNQVIVITGATSGIGLATAYAAADRGARVVLAARNGAALDQVAAVIRGRGGVALPVVADVSDRAAVERVAAEALQAYGGFDTWVNNAGVGIFGTAEEVSEADHRRLFDVNYWGVVHGSLVAAAHLRERGGVLVNLGSILSDVSVPLQGPYCASKAAVRGFTDALRVELEHDRAPVSVVLVKPAAIATPFPQHARNYMDHEPRLPPPLYAPEDVAAAILHAAEHGGRDVYVGGAGRAITWLGNAAPRVLDAAGAMFGPAVSRRAGGPSRPVEGNLYGPGRDGDVRGETAAPPLRTLPPGSGGLVAAGLVLAVAGALLRRRA